MLRDSPRQHRLARRSFLRTNIAAAYFNVIANRGCIATMAMQQYGHTTRYGREKTTNPASAGLWRDTDRGCGVKGCLRLLASAGSDGISIRFVRGSIHRKIWSRSLFYSVAAGGSDSLQHVISCLACGFMPGLPASMARRHSGTSGPAGLPQICDCSFHTACRWPFSSWRRRFSSSTWSSTPSK
ncbi:hypothetical protein FB599_0912 [Herbaspirillum sp. SJZ130]|nr:hypothetical protein FB599_0912 [Herbaspirillum sp. SJZ130]TQK15498.1 hypothetical protein FB598_0849 [Herbaspirillum sp. SJZ106]